MIKKIKDILNNRWYGDILYMIGCFVITTILVDGWYFLTHGEQVNQPPQVQTVTIPVNYVYGIQYKDGTIEDVCANSYIWDGGKVRFFVNDTIVVKTVDSSCIDDVFIKKQKK
jgi:hypothetical protein